MFGPDGGLRPNKVEQAYLDQVEREQARVEPEERRWLRRSVWGTIVGVLGLAYIVVAVVQHVT